MSNIDQWNEWMKERGISQTALAEMLHCSRSMAMCDFVPIDIEVVGG